MNKVIIVDDSIMDREGLRDLIDWGSLNCEVVAIVSNGVEGIKAANNFKPDLIITDVSMPIMNGIEMVQKIKTLGVECAIIFMSCYDEFDYIKSAMDMAASSYLLKPVNPSEVSEVVAKALATLDRKRKDTIIRKHFQNDLPLLREQFIRELLHGVIGNKADIIRQMELYEINPVGYFVVIKAEIDNFEAICENESKEYKYCLIYNVKRCIEDVLPTEVSRLLVVLQKNALAIILMINQKDESDAMNRAIDVVSTVIDLVEKELNVTLTVGVGGLSKNLDDIAGLFEKAEKVLEFKFAEKGNGILMADEVVPSNVNINLDIEQIRSKIELILDKETDYGVEEFFEEYFVQHRLMTEVYVKSLCLIVCNILDNITRNRGSSFETIFGDNKLIWNKLYKFESIIDVKQWLTNIIMVVKESLMHSDTEMRYIRIVADVKEIIDKNYVSIDNVTGIAKMVDVSPNYLHYLFKKYSGQTLLEYIILKRVDEAKKLLIDPYCRIYEVAEKVGYKSTNYFAAVFKKIVGVTPSEFRNMKVNQ